ncbi:MAG: diguanylate cyclase [Desulfovibrio sp.]|mgnify:CR=1 FL=1|nr:MAG: diguanylate cyclase [Desulfovibrio sp.]
MADNKSTDIESLLQALESANRRIAELKDDLLRWHSAIEGARDGVWDWNVVTNEVFFSKRWKDILGYEEHEIAGTFSEWDSRIHPEDKERTYADLTPHLQGSSPFYENVHRVQCKDGSYKWILDRGQVVERDAQGNALRVVGTHTDVTQRTKLEEELRRSQAMLAQSQRLAKMGSWSWEVESGSIQWSEETFRIFGKSPHTFTPDYMSFMDLVHPDDKEALTQAIQLALEGGGKYEVEHRIPLPDGSVKHVRGLGKAEFDSQGKAVRLSGTVQDVTERKEAEQHLRDSEHMLRTMSEASHDALIMIDAQDVIHFWSPAAELMFGYTREEALGSKMHPMITLPDDAEKAAHGLQSFAHTGKGLVMGSTMEFPAIRKDGTQFLVERSVSAFEMGGKWYAVGSLRDITERKEAEAKLEYMATTDSLTGLANRRHFLEMAERELERAHRYGNPLSLLMIDADHFKSVNDTYGHDIGDLVLKALARESRLGLRRVDILSRMGGEEFAALLPEADETTAFDVAERLRKRIQSARVDTEQGIITFTVSIGAASLSRDRRTVEQLLKAADKALYAAKEAGRNQVMSAPK